MQDRKTICLDFDGVIHQYTSWTGEIPENDLIPGIEEFIVGQLLEYNIIISSARDAEEIVKYMSRQIPDLTFLVTNDKLFGYNNEEEGVIGVTNIKPVADFYVDDRAVPFVNVESLYEMLEYMEE